MYFAVVEEVFKYQILQCKDCLKIMLLKNYKSKVQSYYHQNVLNVLKMGTSSTQTSY